MGKAMVVVSPKAHQQWAGHGPDAGFAFGWGGDSGSLVFDYRGKALGLYFGGQRYIEDYETPPVEAPLVDGISLCYVYFPDYRLYPGYSTGRSFL